MKVTYFSQWYRPEPVGPASWIAHAIAESKFEIEVVTATPNYPRGKVYPGYRAFRFKREIIDGIAVTHCPTYPNHGQQAIKRSLNYLSYAVSAFLCGLFKSRKTDAFLVYGSPATAAIPAILLKKIFRKPLVIFIQDLWPDVVLQTQLVRSTKVIRFVRFALEIYDQYMLRNSDQIIVNSEGMKSEILKRNYPGFNLTKVYNWTDESIVSREFDKIELRQRFNIPKTARLFVYGGNIGNAQGLDSWILAIARLQHLQNLYFVFLGLGTERSTLEKLAEELKLQRVFFSDPYPFSDYCRVVGGADAQIISLSPSKIFQITIPGKTQTCLALGIPILASVSGDVRQILLDSGASWIASPGDVNEIANIITEAHNSKEIVFATKGRRGREFYLRNMSKEVGAESLQRILMKVIGVERL